MLKEKGLYSTVDVCDACNISRNILKRYKQAGLIVETTRDKHGYLLFDKEIVEKIGFLRFLQSIGFKIPEIKILLSSSTSDVKKILNEKLTGLHSQIGTLEGYVSTLKELIDADTMKSLIKIYNEKSGAHKWKR